MTAALETVQRVIDATHLVRLQRAADAVFVDPALIEYSVRLAGATRNLAALGLNDLARYVTYGASPRASINMILAGRALALVRGREYALPHRRARRRARCAAPPARAVVRSARPTTSRPTTSSHRILATIAMPDIVLRERRPPNGRRLWAPPHSR